VSSRYKDTALLQVESQEKNTGIILQGIFREGGDNNWSSKESTTYFYQFIRKCNGYGTQKTSYTGRSCKKPRMNQIKMQENTLNEK
jgi:hypothetical protein